jgi:urease accessory protein
MPRSPVVALCVAAGLSAVLPASALAHETTGYGTGFLSGFAHPILGPDHVAAMLAVGLWGAFLGRPAIWLLPIVFPLVMAFGAAAGIVGLPLPAVKTGIALSAVILGLMIALAARPPLWVPALLVGLFAIFHGYAHGAVLPVGVDAFAYAVGFVFGTGCLHMIGIAFGALTEWPAGRIAVRGVGWLISLAGVAFLMGLA